MDIWIITEKDLSNRPIICGSSFEGVTQQLYDYMGYKGKDNEKVIYKGFEKYIPHEEEFRNDFRGTYTFESEFAGKHETDKFFLHELILDEDQKITPFEIKKT